MINELFCVIPISKNSHFSICFSLHLKNSRDSPFWMSIGFFEDCFFSPIFTILCLLRRRSRVSSFGFQPGFVRLDFHLDILDHLCKEGFAFLPCFGVDVMRFAFAVCVGGRVTAFIEVIVDLIDAAGAGLADLAFIRLKLGGFGRFLFCGEFFLTVWRSRRLPIGIYKNSFDCY